MKYLKQVITVTRWEFTRFFKPRNEPIGIIIMLVISFISYFGGKYALSDKGEKLEIAVLENVDPDLSESLKIYSSINQIKVEEKSAFMENLKNERKSVLLDTDGETFMLTAYKKTRQIRKLKEVLNEYQKQRQLSKAGLSQDDLAEILSPAPVKESFIFTDNSGKRVVLPLLFVIASFLVTRDPDNGLAVFLSWFPLTSATAMPMRWAITEVGAWQVAGSFLVLVMTFYFLRKLAAKIFRVSLLITGKEPTWSEAYRLSVGSSS